MLRRVVLYALSSVAIAFASGCRLKFPNPELAPAEIETSIFLIGDAGEPDPRDRENALDSLTAQAAKEPRKSVIVFLGDNVYPDGIPEEGRAEYADARRRLEAQVSAVPQGARAIFLPGNHDWSGTGPFGLYAVRLQEQIITSMAQGRDIKMLPGNGCPGPVSLDLGRLRFISLDTQWWLHRFIIRDAQTKCASDLASVTRALREQVRVTEGHIVVVGGHHPLMTGGEHGGYCGITGPFRRFGGFAQDIISSLNRRMRDSIETALAAQPPLLYVAGHEHNMQVLRGGANVRYLLVSGAGSQDKVACGVWLRESYYVAQHRVGFMRVDILRDKGVFLRVYTYTSDGTGGVAFARWLELR